MNTKIYKVQLCDGGHNDYYYAASDINAIFERKFNYKEKSVELLSDEFIGTFDGPKQKLFYASLTSGRSLYVIANDMKEAYNLLCDNVGDEIKIRTPSGDIQTEFTLSNPENYKIVSVKVDNNPIDTYTINGKILTITDTSILQYGSTIIVEYIQNSFNLEKLREKVISIKINDTEINTFQYHLSDRKLTITNAELSVGDTIEVESIDTHFDLSMHQDKTIVLVSVNGIERYDYQLNNNILTIDNLTVGDKVVVKLVNNNFIVSQNGNKILDVKIDSNKIASDDYVLNGNTITINNLSALYSGEQVSIEMIAKSFTLNQTKDKIISIIVDGREITNENYKYSNNTLIISPEKLTLNSDVVVESIDIHFNVRDFVGNVDSVCILHHGATKEIETNDYRYSNNKLIVDDEQLRKDDIVLFKTINNSFNVSNNQKILTSVKINGNVTEKYKFASGILVIEEKLHVGDEIVVEFFDNHFELKNDIGISYVVEKKSFDSTQSETLSEQKGEYEYNKTKKTLIVYAPLKNGDKIIVKTIDSSNNTALDKVPSCAAVAAYVDSNISGAMDFTVAKDTNAATVSVTDSTNGLCAVRITKMSDGSVQYQSSINALGGLANRKTAFTFNIIASEYYMIEAWFYNSDTKKLVPAAVKYS